MSHLDKNIPLTSMYNRANFHSPTPNITAWVREHPNRQTDRQTKYFIVIGPHRSHDVCFVMWLVPTHHVTCVLWCDWSPHITWRVFCDVIGPHTSHDVCFVMWLVPTHHVTCVLSLHFIVTPLLTPLLYWILKCKMYIWVYNTPFYPYYRSPLMTVYKSNTFGL